MVKLFINETLVSVKKNTTILQACDSIGIDVPRFCFHERLLVAGNCRMCLVEIEKSPKPVPSCTIPVMEGMRVYTETPLVKKAQESVLEFLLINHPLDCPICDQGGECDLQDQSLRFGSDSSRFFIKKRVVEDKNIGPIIKTVMTRCIHCTRCIRFATEIAGVTELGTTGRGKKTEIGVYISKVLEMGLSGNVIDLCPVGALTSKVYAFKARPWELKSINSIDVLDSLCSNIVINLKGNDIVRILPRLNESLNEEWLTDKSRFSFDGIKRQRIDVPYRKDPLSDVFLKISWKKAFCLISECLSYLVNKKGNNIDVSFLLNGLSDLDTLLEAKNLFSNTPLKKSFYFNHQGFKDYINKDNPSNIASSMFNSNLTQSDFILFINTDMKKDLPLVNVKIRNHVLHTGCEVAYIGPHKSFNYSYNHLGLNSLSLLEFLEGKSLLLKKFISAKKPLILMNNSLLFLDISKLSPLFMEINSNTTINMINPQTGFIGCLDLGFDSIKPRNTDLLFNFGNAINNSFYWLDIYIGHTGQSGLDADIILPVPTYLEKSSFYKNFNGITQKSNNASPQSSIYIKDSIVLSMLKIFLSKKIPKIFFPEVGQRFSLRYLKSQSDFLLSSLSFKLNDSSLFHTSHIKFSNESSFLTNNISANSKVMQECELLKKRLNF